MARVHLAEAGPFTPLPILPPFPPPALPPPQECCVYEVHPTDPSLTRWTGYLDVRILHSRWTRFITDYIITQAMAHFKAKTLESLGHDGSQVGFCAKDVFRKICTPYMDPEAGAEAQAVAEAQ